MYRTSFRTGIALMLMLSVSQSLAQRSRQALADTSRFNPIYEKPLVDPKLDPPPDARFRDARDMNLPTAPLTVYGYDLFRTDPALSPSASQVTTLPADYRLGPGDRVGIYLLGNVQERMDVVVNLEGKIFLPPVGVVNVWGLNLTDLKSVLTQKLTPYYDNFHLNIMLLQPKDVMVAVVGDVTRPGKHVLSALNTVLDAVIMAGGPTPKGSIRDVRLIRNGEAFASVDLYQFLMSGSNSKDVFLQSGDRIYVPIATIRVEIDGEVNRPSIFELKPGGGERLHDLIQLAGGLTDFAYTDKIEISRLEDNGQRSLLYADFNSLAAGDSTQDHLLRNEDRITVYSKLEQMHERSVSIYGEIRKPGTYALEGNMHISDLILKAGNLTRKAYRLEAEVAKVDPGKPARTLKINLEGMLSGANGDTDPILEEDDQVFIRQIPKWEVGPLVEIKGEVMFPGKYSVVKDSTYLSAIIAQSGGLTKDAFPQEAVLLRESSRVKFDKEYERLKEMSRDQMTDLEYQYLVMRQNSADIKEVVVDFERLISHNDNSQDVIVEDGDVIIVPKAPTVVTVTGSVAKPGGVTYRQGADLSYYLAKAGGPSWDASVKQTKIVKVSGEVVDDEDVRTFQAGDLIWVPRKSESKFWPVALQTITVMAQLASVYLIVDTSINR